jgi:cobalt-zinc-cadmium efflux system membrane fusion protein
MKFPESRSEARPRRRRAVGRRAVAAVVIAWLLAGCGKLAADGAADGAAVAADRQAPARDPDIVVAQPSLASRLKVAPVDRQSISERLRVPGSIDFDEHNVARIGASVSGRVTELFVTPGQSVEAGDVLAQLHSTELGAAQLVHQKARAQRDLQARALERARVLLAADVIGSAELQRRQSELAMADAELRAAADQLRLMGVPPARIAQSGRGELSSVSPVVASMGGTVVERKVTRGQVVQQADDLFTIADLSRVWVVGQVPESAATRVRVGQTVEIEVGAPGERIVGKLDWVSDIVDPQTRTVTVRTELGNRERGLRPSMLATLVIHVRPEEQLAVATSAVVRAGNRDFVFVQTGQDQYRLTPVDLGDESNGLRPIRSGLVAGQPIVVEGAFHLNNEHRRAGTEGA